MQPNFAEVELGNTDIELYRAEYSKEFFKECIEEDSGDFFYYREGSFIYALPEREGLTRPVGFNIQNVAFNDFPYLTAKILNIALKKLFESHGREVFKQKYASTSVFTIEKEQTLKIGALELVPKCIFSVNPITRT